MIGRPLMEAAAQTFVGAIAGYSIDKVKGQIFKENTFEGAFDFWNRGIHYKSIQEGDRFCFEGLISPYIQLFPRDPYENAKRWNELYSFEGKISAQEFSNLEFYAGSDDTIRTGSLNGETLVGLYARYGYIGEGVLGVASTSMIQKNLPDFFLPEFWGRRAQVKGTLSYCPTQHGFIAQKMFSKAGIDMPVHPYHKIPYMKIDSIKLYNKPNDRIASLLGSPWAATSIETDPYLVQYGYISDAFELGECISKIKGSKNWDNVRVFYDDITSPDPTISFSNTFIR